MVPASVLIRPQAGDHATAFAGFVVILAIVVAFMVELARGHSGSPYTWRGAIAGLSYFAGIVVFGIRG